MGNPFRVRLKCYFSKLSSPILHLQAFTAKDVPFRSISGMHSPSDVLSVGRCVGHLPATSSSDSKMKMVDNVIVDSGGHLLYLENHGVGSYLCWIRGDTIAAEFEPVEDLAIIPWKGKSDEHLLSMPEVVELHQDIHTAITQRMLNPCASFFNLNYVSFCHQDDVIAFNSFELNRTGNCFDDSQNPNKSCNSCLVEGGQASALVHVVSSTVGSQAFVAITNTTCLQWMVAQVVIDAGGNPSLDGEFSLALWN